ncbi:Peptidyl-prolyl cis-trans isomerase Pin1 [Glycine soja]
MKLLGLRCATTSWIGDVRASHILINHEGSRRKDLEAYIIKSTTRENVISQLQALRNDIVLGKATFEDIAFRFSNCSSTKHGGDLGQSKN